MHNFAAHASNGDRLVSQSAEATRAASRKVASFSTLKTDVAGEGPEGSRPIGSLDLEQLGTGKRPSNWRSRRSASDKGSGADPKRCHCVKSQCLKLYCECFARGAFCNGCNCSDCQNMESNAEVIEKKRQDVRQRDPEAFKDSIKAGAHRKGCNCKRSQCLKMYCECFKNGVACGDNCKCNDCLNVTDGMSDKMKQDGGALQPRAETLPVPALQPIPVADGYSMKGKLSGSWPLESDSPAQLPVPSSEPTPTRAKSPPQLFMVIDKSKQGHDPAMSNDEQTHSKNTPTTSHTDDDDHPNNTVHTMQLAPPSTPSLVSQHGHSFRSNDIVGSADGRRSLEGSMSLLGNRSASFRGSRDGSSKAKWGHQKKRSGPGRPFTAADSGGDSRPTSHAGEETSAGSMHGKPQAPSPTMSSPLATALQSHPPTPDLPEYSTGSLLPQSKSGLCMSPSVPLPGSLWMDPKSEVWGRKGDEAALEGQEDHKRRWSEAGLMGRRWPEERQQPTSRKEDLEQRLNTLLGVPPERRGNGPPVSYREPQWEQSHEGHESALRAASSKPLGRAWTTPRARKGDSQTEGQRTDEQQERGRGGNRRADSGVGASPSVELLTGSLVGQSAYPGGRTPDAGLLLDSNRDHTFGLKHPCVTEEEQRQAQAFFHDSPVPTGPHAQQALLLSPMTPRALSLMASHGFNMSPSPAKLDTGLLRGWNKRTAGESDLNQSATKQFRWTDDSPSSVPLLAQLLTPKPDDWMMQELLMDFPGMRSPNMMTPLRYGGDTSVGIEALASRYQSPLSLALAEQQVARQPKSRRMLRWSANGQCLPSEADNSVTTGSSPKDAESMRVQAFQYMSAATQDTK